MGGVDRRSMERQYSSTLPSEGGRSGVLPPVLAGSPASEDGNVIFLGASPSFAVAKVICVVLKWNTVVFDYLGGRIWIEWRTRLKGLTNFNQA